MISIFPALVDEIAPPTLARLSVRLHSIMVRLLPTNVIAPLTELEMKELHLITALLSITCNPTSPAALMPLTTQCCNDNISMSSNLMLHPTKSIPIISITSASVKVRVEFRLQTILVEE